MYRKEMVYNPKTGRYEEKYVDQGPARALPGHGNERGRRGTIGTSGMSMPPSKRIA